MSEKLFLGGTLTINVLLCMTFHSNIGYYKLCYFMYCLCLQLPTPVEIIPNYSLVFGVWLEKSLEIWLWIRLWKLQYVNNDGVLIHLLLSWEYYDNESWYCKGWSYFLVIVKVPRCTILLYSSYQVKLLPYWYTLYWKKGVLFKGPKYNQKYLLCCFGINLLIHYSLIHITRDSNAQW